eukprot:761636_1
MVILEYMGPFPQTPPKPVDTYYDRDFDTHDTHDIPCMFYLSQKMMRYPLCEYDRTRGRSRREDEEFNTIICDWNDAEDEVNGHFDIRDCLGLYDALHATDLEGYVLSEIYHLYWKSMMSRWTYASRGFVLVGKLKSTSHAKEVFIYWDYAEGDRAADTNFVSFVLSEFWNDVWPKIPSDAIKVDCYNNTKLPHPASLQPTLKTPQWINDAK